MKRFSLFVLLLCACLVLTACTATDPDNLFEIPEGNTAPSDAESTQVEPDETESAPSDAEEVILYTGTYQYGNMQKNAPPGDFMLLNNKVLFSHLVNNSKFMLYSYDLITEEVQFYCQDATCKHGDCAAGSLFGNLEVYNGKLYGMNRNRQPVVLNGDAVEVINSFKVNSFFHYEDKLFVSTPDSSFVVMEERMNEPQVVLEEHIGYWHVIFDGCLYASTVDNIIKVDLSADAPKEEVVISNARGMTDGKHIYYVDNKTSQLYRCDMHGGNTELLVEQQVLLASMNFDDEYFYYRLYTDLQLNGTADSRDIYRFSKENPTQIEKIVTLPVSAFQIFTVPGTGKIFVNTHAPEGEECPIYVMNSDGSDLKKLELPEA